MSELPPPYPAPALVADNFVRLPDEQRAKIKQLAQAATPGPYTQHSEDDGNFAECRIEWEVVGPARFYDDNQLADAAYFAAIPPEIALGTLAYVEHLEAENTRLTARLAAETQAAAETEREKWEAFKELATLRLAQWTPIADDCPPMGEEVWLYGPEIGAIPGYLDAGEEEEFWEIGAEEGLFYGQVTHWQTKYATLPAPTQEGRPERGEVAKPLTCQCSMSMVMRGKDGAGYCAACGLVVPEAGIDSPSEDDDEPI